MKRIPLLADNQHPLVRETAKELAGREKSVVGMLEKLFYYVRDDIRFGFPADGDLVKASETVRSRAGQCNTKSTLFLALCKVVDIPARIHFSLIRKEIQRGLFTGIGYALLPSLLSHSWLEVKIDQRWVRIDAFINDLMFYNAGKTALKEKGWTTGYSISCDNGDCSAEFSIEKEGFMQMDAVVTDHGVWNDPSEYYGTDAYRNRPNPVVLLFYRFMIKRVNRRVARMRSSFGGAGKAATGNDGGELE